MPPSVLWSPPRDIRDRSEIGRYLGWLEARRGRVFADYDELWRWSVDDLPDFWASIIEFFEVELHAPPSDVLEGAMPDARWFPGATISYPEHALRGSGPVAVIARSETRGRSTLSWDELRDQVDRCRSGLRRLGVGPGDVVAGYLPNIPEAVVAFLATAGLGATWSACPPELGAPAVVDRLGQLEPVVLIGVRGYRHRGRYLDRSRDLADAIDALPSLRHVVEVPYGTSTAGHLAWDELLADVDHEPPAALPFEHPLYVLFSSGTTGRPKAIVHGHGAMVVEHLKYLALHHDLTARDRFLWFTTTGWMMWNFLVSGLLVGATIVLLDGDPSFPDASSFWRLVADEQVSSVGVGAAFLDACRHQGIDPSAAGDLSRLRTIGSTGSPLGADTACWVHERLPHPVLASISGGTDVCTAFVGGVRLLPVVAGEITCRALGADVQAFDEAGGAVVGAQGELVLARPMPSMPVSFWGDADGSARHAAYFERHPGVWAHGDWIELTTRGSCVISGRSDATLNRGGVRTGTAEIYAALASVDEVVDSLVVHLDDVRAASSDALVLLVQLAAGAILDDGVRDRIATACRVRLSPRHVPDEIWAVEAVLRTPTGKRMEVLVKRVLSDPAPPGSQVGADVADPTAWSALLDVARRRNDPSVLQTP